MDINQKEPPITQYLYQKASRLEIPLSGTFELTPVCNMSCRMCYVRMTEKQQRAIRPLRTAKEWIELGAEAKEKGMLYLLLTGGEPFSRPDFQEIFTELHKMGFLISVNTNGTLIDEAAVDWLKKTPPVRMNITLYGASDQTYLDLCGNPRGYTQTTHAIHLLKDAGISVKLNCSVTPYNEQDLEKIYAYAEQEKLILQAVSYMFPPLRRDRAMIGQNDRFTPAEAAYQQARIDCLSKGKERFLEMAESNSLSFSNDYEEDCQGLEDGKMNCRAGKCAFWITWDGRMLPCGMFAEGGYDVFEEGFESSWKKTLEDTKNIRLAATCNACPKKEECRPCAAMALTETGDFRGVPEYRCQMTKIFPEKVQQLIEKIKEEQHGF